MVELLNIDCMEYMKGLSDKSFDLAIVDPPYGINANGMTMGLNKGTIKRSSQEWDSQIPDQKYFNELFRVSRNQIIWGGNYYPSIWPCKGFIIWDKRQEKIPFRNMGDSELAWTSFDTVPRTFRYLWDGFQKGAMDTGTQKIHPTMKPVQLYKWLLTNYAICKHCQNNGSIYEDVVGDGGSKMLIDCECCDVAEFGQPKILDTHLGSGSSAIAAHEMGFSFVGCEIDKGYYDAAVKRFNEKTMQQSLFKSA